MPSGIIKKNITCIKNSQICKNIHYMHILNTKFNIFLNRIFTEFRGIPNSIYMTKITHP